MKILHRDDLTLGGFAGLREHRLVVSSKAFESKREADSWEGLGNFVYLADAMHLCLAMRIKSCIR